MSRPSTSGTFDRDPVSVLLDRGARRLLERAYASPGQWVTTRLADPTPEHLAHFRAQGIDLLERDKAGRALDARTRWCRGFVRAAYYQHTWYSNIGAGRGWRSGKRTAERRAGALKLEVGRHMPELGVIPPGRIVRAILYPGGQAAQRGADRASAQYIGGGPAAADPSRRDW